MTVARDDRRTFYRIDSSKVSFREFWWGSPAGALLVAPVVKLFRIRLAGATDDPNVEVLAPFAVEAEALPEATRDRMSPLVHELSALGYANPIHHLISDPLHQVETHLVTMAHHSGRSWARVHERVWSVQSPPKVVLFTEIVTEFEDRSAQWSLSSKPDLAAPPRLRVVRKTGASPSDLVALHEAELARTQAGRRVVSIGSEPELRAAIERHHAQVRNFHLRRGVFAALTADDRAKGQAALAARRSATQEGSRFPEILAEVRALQEKRTNWVSAVLVLLVSLSVFVGTTGGSWSILSKSSLNAALLLVPILLFHEAGHWLAMRFFGYRNLRMFFIPFLGAAVSGQYYNVAGWKKAVVSLMGPLPGILVGTVLGVVGMLTQQPLLSRIALTMLAINGFNLLPILPLDGGWAVQALFAARHAVLDVVFRGLAVVALVGLAILSHDRILTFLAIAMAVALPVSYKLARITSEVQASGAERMASDDQTIPSATADAIIERVQERFPKRYNNKQKAQFTLQIFEALNARPPRMLASLALGFVQAASLAGAVLFAVLFTVAGSADLAGLMRAAETLPSQTLDPASLASWRSSSVTAPSEQRLTVVANFADAVGASDAFSNARGMSEPDLAVQVIGQTLLVSVPSADESARGRWVEQLTPQAKDVFVATAERPAMMSVSCLAQSTEAATLIEHELGDYLIASALFPIPPWAEADARTADERQRHARARRTYARLVSSSPEELHDPREAELTKRLMEAHRLADKAAVARLVQEHASLLAALRAERVQRLKGEPDTDAAVADAFLALGDGFPGPDGGRAVAELGPLLGQVELTEGRPAPSAERGAARGLLSREGLLLHAPMLMFSDAFVGAPVALRWLQARGCVDFRYALSPGFTPADSADDDS